MRRMSRRHIGNLDDYDVGEALSAFVRNVLGEDVEVHFAEGVAALSGTVRTPAARRAIEDMAMAHDGVMSVVNNIVVAPALSPRETGQPA